VFVQTVKLCLVPLATSILWCQFLCIEGHSEEGGLDYTVDLTVVRRGWDGTKCYVHSRAGAIPPGAPGNPTETPIVVMTTQKHLVKGNDIFDGLEEFRTDDLGQTWDGPQVQPALDRRQMGPDLIAAPCDFTPQWHARTGKLLGTGKTFWYKNNNQYERSPSEMVYAAYDPANRSWSAWNALELPNDPKFENASAGCAQRYDLPNGDILLPIYYRRRDARHHRVTICRCRFDGQTLRFVEHGDELELSPEEQHGDGLSESSLTRFGDRFYLTLRAVDRNYVTTSKDGLHFDALRRWTFDDGEDLGSYNTQQHWVTHSDGLYVVYTRRGADNDHVFRHRAPLLMARVDPEKLVVLRDTERIIVPQTGTRMGNFGIVDVSREETWVITTEWMQQPPPGGFEKYGSDNRIFSAKIRWNRPNELVAW